MWMVDGGEDYDRGSGGKFSIMPSQDSISEFRILSSNYSAEYGMGSGATLSMAFKSGTRDFHGEAWELRTLIYTGKVCGFGCASAGEERRQ